MILCHSKGLLPRKSDWRNDAAKLTWIPAPEGGPRAFAKFNSGRLPRGIAPRWYRTNRKDSGPPPRRSLRARRRGPLQTDLRPSGRGGPARSRRYVGWISPRLVCLRPCLDALLIWVLPCPVNCDRRLLVSSRSLGPLITQLPVKLRLL